MRLSNSLRNLTLWLTLLASSPLIYAAGPSETYRRNCTGAQRDTSPSRIAFCENIRAREEGRTQQPRGGSGARDGVAQERRGNPRTERSNWPGSVEQIMQQIRAAAIEAADDAYARNNDSQIRRIKAKLQVAKIKHSNSSCGRVTTGCADLGGIRIWLTDDFFKTSPNFQILVMLHEAAHLIGISNECASNRLARKIMSDAGLPYEHTSYDQMCGVSAPR